MSCGWRSTAPTWKISSSSSCRGDEGHERAYCHALSRNQDSHHQSHFYLLGPALSALLHPGIRGGGELGAGIALRLCGGGLQRIFPGRGFGDGDRKSVV